MRERNEFSAFNRVLSAAYALDDCDLESSPEPRIAGTETVVVQPRTISAGRHQFKFVVRVRSAISPDYPAHDQVITNAVPVTIRQGGTSSITVRIFDDPRKHLSFVMVMTSHYEDPPRAPQGGAR